MKAKTIREFLNEEEYSDNRFIQQWIDDLIKLLENHKITQFGGSTPIENIDVAFLTDGAADITCSVNTGKVVFNIYFSLRDVRTNRDPGPKWESEIAISSPARKGSFGKKVTGKNTLPKNLIQVLSNIFDLKYGRR